MRRSRYTIEFHTGEKRVILAFSAEQVREHFARRGETVKVTKGDYRKAARTPERAPERRWVIDQAALREALEMLGIDWEVKIENSARQGGCYGSHMLRYHGTTIKGTRLYNLDNATAPYHRIVLKTWRTAEEAGRTLWHELAHAMQAERAAKRAGATTCRQIHMAWNGCAERGTGVRYEYKPIEVEARAHEEYNDVVRLVREV